MVQLLTILLIAFIGAQIKPGPMVNGITRVVGVSDGDVVQGGVEIWAETTDAVTRVDFLLQGPRTFSWTEQRAPWWFLGDHTTWDTTTFPDGSYTLNVTASHATGGKTALARHFVVANTALPQGALASIVGVNNSERLRGTAYIGVETSGSVDQVKFDLVGAQALVWIERKAPWWFFGNTADDRTGWDTTAFPDGVYTLLITAYSQSKVVGSARRTFELVNTQPESLTEPLPVQRPALSQPKIVYLNNNNPSYVGNGAEDIQVVVTEKMTVPAAIRDVRNLVMVGGEFTIAEPIPSPLPSVPADCAGWRTMNELTSRHKALTLANISGAVWLEGLYINGSNGNMTEGLMAYDTSGQQLQAQFYLVNLRIEGARTTLNERWPSSMPACAGGLADRPKLNKSDLIEGLYGSWYLYKVTARGSDYQGLYWSAEFGASLGEVELHHVNIADVHRQAVAINRSGRSDKEPVWTVSENVWNAQDQSFTANSSITYPYMFDEHSPNMIVRAKGQAYVAWSMGHSPLVSDYLRVNLGSPPGGDFAPADRVGREYLK